MRLSDLLFPKEEIAGLELSDSGAHLVLFALGAKMVSKSGVIFPPGLIEDGEVKDRLKLVRALEILKVQAGPKKLKENLYVIVSLPSRNVYSQILELPPLSPAQIEEAIKWNAQMTLPLEPAKTYFDWQEIKSPFGQDLKKEFFVALAAKTKIDPYLDVLEEAGFVPLAIEMPTLGLTRLVHFFITGIDKSLSYLIAAVDWSGVDLTIIKEGSFRFNYYRAWSSKEKQNLTAGRMTPEDLADILALDIQKITNFYESKNHENIAGIILISSLGQKKELGESLKFKTGLDVIDFRPQYFSEIDDAWYPALGSALRGIIPREEDTVVSLMPVGTEEHYQKQKLLSFVSFWGNISGTVFAGLAGLFLILSLFFGQVENRFSRQMIVFPSDLAEVKSLEAKALEFNNLVAGILNADNASRVSREWDHIFYHIFRAAEPADATILRLSSVSLQSPVTIQASTPLRENALDFKRRLEEALFFYDVQLPLTGFVQGLQVSFNISFSIDWNKLLAP
ncbi:MAG: hypothetical protein Q8L57_03640 [bacterium]|nr:hypothetical protein [bacterium]